MKIPRAPKVAGVGGGSGGLRPPKFGTTSGLGSIRGQRGKFGADPVSMMKKFFLYRNVFGNMGGPPQGLGAMGQMTPVKAGIGSGLGPNPLGTPGGMGSPGDISGLATARRMGLI